MKFAEDTFNAGDDLLKCLQVTLGTCAPAELSLTPERWVAVANLATKAQVSPILFKGLSALNPSLGIPKEVMSRWLREYLSSAGRNNRLYQHLAEVVAAFGESGIPVMLLKGAHLMDHLYPERAMRMLGDIDILVKPEDKVLSMQIMENLGYVADTPACISDPIHCTYIHSTSGSIVEVHFTIDLGLSAKSDLTGFWDRSESTEIDGYSVRMMSSNDLLVHLSLHLTHHLLATVLFAPVIRCLYDIAFLMQKHRERLDEDTLIQILSHLQGSRQFAIPVSLAEKLLQVPPLSDLDRSLNTATVVYPEDIATLREHLLLSCERDLTDARIPKFIRSSTMADRTNIFSGFIKRVFVSPEEIRQRYGSGSHRQVLLWKYLQHFSFLLKVNFTPKKWVWGQDTLTLARHFKKISVLKERMKSE